MTPYLVDTNHVSAMLKGHPAMVAKIAQMAGKASLGIAIPSVAELWYMTFFSSKIQQNTADAHFNNVAHLKIENWLL